MGIPDIAVLVGSLTGLILLASPALARGLLWRATITPLASIIGSGFLIVGPILVSHFGKWAWLPMALLCLAGFAFGTVIRFNIAVLAEGGGQEGSFVYHVEKLSSWMLTLAYLVSVAYYLNLFGSFAARIVGSDTGLLARFLTTLAYGLILVVGFLRGFASLERMEQVAVSLKLAIIVGLLGGLVSFAAFRWQAGELVTNKVHWGFSDGYPLVFGLLVTVQGFETSRYLGDSYAPSIRIRSMLIAQLVASAIYMTYVIPLSASFASGGFALSETAIIDLMTRVSTLLAPMLILAALSSQFSAAVADTACAGGLVEELTASKLRLDPRWGYVLVVFSGLVLTWIADIFSIISYASRAFALYYAIQSCLAAVRAWRLNDARKIFRTVCYAGLAILGLAIVVLGTPIDA